MVLVFGERTLEKSIWLQINFRLSVVILVLNKRQHEN